MRISDWSSDVCSSDLLYRIRPDGSVDMTLDVGGGPNGLAVDADGVLYVAQNGGVWGAGPGQEPGIQRVNDGKVEYIVTGMAAPNDLCRSEEHTSDSSH